MMELSEEQRDAVNFDGHLVVTACPGSGKTRVLTCRVLRGLRELASEKQRVIALTFTNRAADEIQSRLDKFDVPSELLWAGTIHSFALEWILRPYAPYIEEIRCGFAVADEHYSERAIAEIKEQRKFEGEVLTSLTRSGLNPNQGGASAVFDLYKSRLRAAKLVDYDDILYLAYKLLAENPEVAETLSLIMPLICVDEVQDMQDLQYGILSQIVNGSRSNNVLFLVGDENQSIYESLGALTKTPAQIAKEFGLSKIENLGLRENYRSTQRIVDYFTKIRPKAGPIKSLAKHAAEHGKIRFINQDVHKDGLPKLIAGIVRDALAAGVEPDEICIIAPQWWHVIALTRALMLELPDVGFDAPGLSPLHATRDNVWFKVARLFLTKPEPNLVRTRLRWAQEVISDIERMASVSFPDSMNRPRLLLRFVNATASEHRDGLDYLREVFDKLMAAVSIKMELQPELAMAQEAFFAKASSRMEKHAGGMPSDIDGLRKLFRSPSGVVVNTCHGVKGEEYNTVIAFGLLKGYVPNWGPIIRGEHVVAEEQASKLLYVICSRAKKQLYLISESGRETLKKRPYETTSQLARIGYKYDD